MSHPLAAQGIAAVLAGALVGCVVAQRPTEVPDTTEAVVVVGSAALGEPLNGIARHPFVALRDAGATEWERWEVMCCPNGSRLSTVRRAWTDPTSDRGGGGGDVRFHRVLTGASAERAAACVRQQAPEYPRRDRYLAWPGPNSNTFVDWIARKCDLHVDLPAPSIGKDYRGLVGISGTSGGTGVQLETPLVGAKIGLTEGVEAHLLGMAIGVDVWPPALIVPVGPGRIGFADRSPFRAHRPSARDPAAAITSAPAAAPATPAVAEGTSVAPVCY